MSALTNEQRFEIIQQYLAALDSGDDEEATRLHQLLPMAPQVAKVAKQVLGSQFLKESDFNLSDAEAEYGPNWLDQ